MVGVEVTGGEKELTGNGSVGRKTGGVMGADGGGESLLSDDGLLDEA